MKQNRHKAFREKKILKRYRKFLASRGETIGDPLNTSGASCLFCHTEESGNPIIEFSQNFIVMKNRFPYRYFENRPVIDHLLLVPRRHISSLSEFSNVEAEEFLAVAKLYDEAGYTLFNRSISHKGRSVWHQHAHFIKVEI